MMTIMVKKPKSSVSTRTKLRVTAVPGRSPMMMLLIAAFGLCVQAAKLVKLSQLTGNERYKMIRGHREEEGTEDRYERRDYWDTNGIGTHCKNRKLQWHPALDFRSIDKYLKQLTQYPLSGNLRLAKKSKDYVGSGVFKVTYGAITTPTGWCGTPNPQPSERFVVKFGWKADKKTEESFHEERDAYEIVEKRGLTRGFLAKTWFLEFRRYVVWIQPRMDESLRSYMVNKYTPLYKQDASTAVQKMKEELRGILDGFWDKAKQCGIFIADLHQDNVRRVTGGVWHVTDFQFEQSEEAKGLVSKKEQLNRWVCANVGDLHDGKVYE